MGTIRSHGLFELPAEATSSPFEVENLAARTSFQSRAPRAGADFKSIALQYLVKAGAQIVSRSIEINGLPVDAKVSGTNGRPFLVLARGTPDEQERGGLRRTDTVEKVGFMAMQLTARQPVPVLVVTSDLPDVSTKAALYLAYLSDYVWDVVALRGDMRGFQRLSWHLSGPPDAQRPLSPWQKLEAAPQPLFSIE